jgi:hypothetical protein
MTSSAPSSSPESLESLSKEQIGARILELDRLLENEALGEDERQKLLEEVEAYEIAFNEYTDADKQEYDEKKNEVKLLIDNISGMSRNRLRAIQMHMSDELADLEAKGREDHYVLQIKKTLKEVEAKLDELEKQS